MSIDAEAIRQTLKAHAEPDPATITFIPKGGAKLEAVGHAEVTRILLEVDPEFNWEPQAWDENGGPRYVNRTLKSGKGQLVMWGFFTLHGKTMPCVGTCEADKDEADKELIGDLLRNGAMRFGIALNLWSKAEKASPDYQPNESDGAENGNGHKATPPTPPALPPFVPSPAAIAVMVDALECEDPLGAPPGGEMIPEWKWKLAEKDDDAMDAVKWPVVADFTGLRVVDLLDRAKSFADQMGHNVPEPERMDDVHGDLALELRRWLLAADLPF